ncbi:MAG: COQ9 family protein [Geminicoccaceae bacterium]
MSRPTSREEQRDRLLEAALVHVPFEGWSRRSLRAGAADMGLEPGLARRLFPRAGDDLLVQVERWADRQMLARAGPLEGLRVRDRIARLVRSRLEALGPHREAMRRATAARMLPSNGFAACGSLWRTVDLMWSAAGDEARDASYYTKRSLLAAVWTSTFLFWLDNRSPDFEGTWAFLDRRIDNVMQIGKLRARFDDWFRDLGRLNPLAQRR